MPNLENSQQHPGDFTNLNLYGYDFSHKDLSGARFTNANLEGANFCNADLTEAEFFNANLRKANLTRADLAGASFAGADLTEAVVKHACLAQANLQYAVLRLTSFKKSDLTGANLKEAKLIGTDFTQSILKSALIAESDLNDRCSLNYTTLPNGQLSDGDALPMLGESWDGRAARPSNQVPIDDAKATKKKRSRHMYRGHAVADSTAQAGNRDTVPVVNNPPVVSRGRSDNRSALTYRGRPISNKAETGQAEDIPAASITYRGQPLSPKHSTEQPPEPLNKDVPGDRPSSYFFTEDKLFAGGNPMLEPS